MSDAANPHLTEPYGPRTRSCATELACRECGYRTPLLDTAFKCPACGEGPRRRLRLRARQGSGSPSAPSRSARWNIWRFEELLPIVNRRAQQRVGQFAGKTPLIHADRLGAELGLSNLYLKDDSTNRPSLSYKDRVVGHGDRPPARAGQGRGRLRLDRQRRHRGRRARGQGRRQPPTSSTRATWRRARRRPAARSAPRSASSTATTTRPTAPVASWRWPPGWSSPTSPCARSTPRGRRRWPSRSSRSWAGTAPDHFVIPAAGGTLSSRVHKGLNELETVGLAETAATKIDIAQAERLLADRDRDHSSGGEIVTADAGDGGALAGDRRSRRRRPGRRRGPHRAAARRRPPPTRRSSSAIDLLGATEGILTEPAGGTTIASTAKLAAGREDRPRRRRRRDHQRQRPEDASGAPRQALAGNGHLRGRDDGGRCSTTSASQRRPRCTERKGGGRPARTRRAAGRPLRASRVIRIACRP